MNDITDAGDVVHIDIIKFGKSNQAFHGNPYFAFFVVGIGGLRNMNGIGHLRLIQIVIVTKSADTGRVQHGDCPLCKKVYKVLGSILIFNGNSVKIKLKDPYEGDFVRR